MSVKQPVWEQANSDTIEKFAYIEEYGDLLVTFKKGGEYVYRGVPKSVYVSMKRPHPWRRLRDEIAVFPYEKLGGIRTEPLKGRGNAKTTAGKAIDRGKFPEAVTTPVESKPTAKVATKPRARRTKVEK